MLAGLALLLPAGGRSAPALSTTRSYSFETGMEGWRPNAMDVDDPPVEWSILPSRDRARLGRTSLRLHLGNDVSRQIFIAGCYDPNEFAFLDRYLRPGMTFIDAGANEGVYTVFAAQRVGSEGCVWACFRTTFSQRSRRYLHRRDGIFSLVRVGENWTRVLRAKFGKRLAGSLPVR